MSLLLALLLGVPDIDDTLKTFASEMKSASSAEARVAAIETLAKTRHPKAAGKLLPLIRGPYSPAVRLAAAKAVGRIGSEKSGPALMAVLNSFGNLLASENPNKTDDQKVAEEVIRAMGACRARSCVPRLCQLLSKNNTGLMREACHALAKIRDASAVDPLLRLDYAANSPEGVGAVNPRKSLIPDTGAALRRLTGLDFPNPDEWREWYRVNGRAFRPPPEAALGGLPEEVATFAVYAGKGETETLLRFDLVLLDPKHHQKRDLENMRAIALSGDLKAAAKRGFVGGIVEPAEAESLRQRHPEMFLVCRGADAAAIPHVNAVLVTDLDPAKEDDPALAAVKDAVAGSKTAVLAVFTAPADEAAALKLAEDNGFLAYIAPDADRMKIDTRAVR